LLFWDESWFRLEADGSAVVGAVMPGMHSVTPTEVRLPRIGEVVYQGLPMAGVVVPHKAPLTVPAPISGVVVAVNESLLQRPDWLGSDPCGEGWMACVCTTQAEDDAARCRPRCLVLVNADADSACAQSRTLEGLGCRVWRVADCDGLLGSLRDVQHQVVLLDAASLGDAGPEWVGLVNRQAPKVRVIVIASSGDARETSYRKQKILYYAVEPFADGEMADILLAASRGHETAAAEAHKGPSEPISSIVITNREGHRVSLLAAPGLLWRHEGLGSEIGHKLLDKMLPVVITPGVANLSTPNILKTATAFDRLMVLLANDRGLLPGSLARNTKPDFEVDPGDAAGKVTTLSVQPDAMGGLGGLDSRTTAALADHIVREMVLS
jgi:glycine cleavage system H protein